MAGNIERVDGLARRNAAARDALRAANDPVQSDLVQAQFNVALWRKDADALLDALLAGAGPETEFGPWKVPASFAAATGSAPCLDLLAEAGASLDRGDQEGWTPATHAASREGPEYLSCLRALAKREAPLDEPDDSGRRPAWHAAWMDRPENLDFLIGQGADVLAVDKQGFGLAMAAMVGGPRCVEIVARAGADMDAADLVGVTALMGAARDGRMGSVAALIRAGARPNVQNKAGMTAAMLAVDDGQTTGLEIIEILIDAGADLSIADNLGRRVADLAKDPGAKEFLKAAAERQALGEATPEPCRGRGPKRV